MIFKQTVGLQVTLFVYADKKKINPTDRRQSKHTGKR